MIRTVTLELLRHGPANNQLLSTLTPYLALCGNHDAETVQVGFEHVQLMRRMRALRYEEGSRQARAALSEAADEVGRLIASIRSLTAELSSAPRSDRGLVHLRLVLSASELSLLPFELVTAPSGFPGQGQALCLQTVMPLALTREVRRVAAATVRWPAVPRILVVAAAPRGAQGVGGRPISPVPLRAHLLAIRRALAPWLVTNAPEEFGRHVTVLPEATLAEVREACAATPFTHVHVLAHGYGSDEDGELRYGLAFHRDEDRTQVDVVSGSRLAAALRCHPNAVEGTELGSPTVVTVASCDSGNVGSVVAQGASVAHELHEAGIPLVLASQFPLSVRGSAILAEVVYRRLLRGDDPRLLVHDVRQELHVTCPDTHDWAAIVAYAALPPDIEAQVKQARFQRARRAVDTVMARLDRAQRPSEEDLHTLEAVMHSFEAAVPDEDTPAQRVKAYGLLASAKKRAALLYHGGPVWPLITGGGASMAMVMRALPGGSLPPPPAPGGPASVEGDVRPLRAQLASRTALEEARSYYMRAFRMTGNEPWSIVQWLALTAAIDPLEDTHTQESFADRWTAARVIAEDTLALPAVQQVVWAHSALAELYVLAQVLPEGHRGRHEMRALAERHVDDLLALVAEEPYPNARFDAYSLVRQLLRYAEWWWRERPYLRALPTALADRMRLRGVRVRWESVD
ncbi:CHAT domain-containing protein [Chondromyces apiculatus]|uniref:CHAT domain-containing protein n=1 Tax=Chondromyces apiculatus DSM 436 TaxID=1192034 RepID=A0A017SX56_9BACT|nr:CHAT domain-containing protein [Chondromyces apiculatus]EYF00911.1 Hypothetical protein CAP_8859 [Chondromyces apiculatus DSM 436]